MAKIRTLNDLIKYVMDNNIDTNKGITIGVEGYHTYDEDANIEDRELNIEILPNGEVLIADDGDYEELKKEPTQEYGFQVTETRVRNIKVSACNYDEAYDIAERLMNNNKLDMDDNSYIDNQELEDYHNLDNCDDFTEDN